MAVTHQVKGRFDRGGCGSPRRRPATRGCRSRWFRACGGRGVPGSSGDRCRLRADGWRSCDAASHHTAHSSPRVTICYRHHPFHDSSGCILRRSRYRGGEQFVVQLDDGTASQCPPGCSIHCSVRRLIVEPRPRLSLASLREVRRLIDSHPLSRTVELVSIGDSSSPSGELHEARPSSDEAPAPAAATFLCDERSGQSVEQLDRDTEAGMPASAQSNAGSRRPARPKRHSR